MNNTPRIKARQLYEQYNGDIPLADIASKLNVSHSTLRSWKHRDNWDKLDKIIDIEKNSKRYRAMMIYLVNNKEIQLADIARELNVPHGTVRSWKYKDNWDEKYPYGKKEWMARERVKNKIDKTIQDATKNSMENILKEIKEWAISLTELKSIGEEHNIEVEEYIHRNITKSYNKVEDKEIIRPILKSFIESLDRTEVFSDIKDRKYIDETTRYRLFEKAGFKCQACGSKPEKNNDVALHIDHVVPHSLGGSNEIENLQVLCHRCNISKGNEFNINHNIGWERRA